MLLHLKKQFAKKQRFKNNIENLCDMMQISKELA